MISNDQRKDVKVVHPVSHAVKRVLAGLGLAVVGLLALILLFGLVPLPLRGLEPQPVPAGTYDEALVRFAAVEAAEADRVNELGHSRLLTAGERTPRVYAMVHGTTNSPEQWQELGETLHARGHNVLILRMPYHGLQSHRGRELRRLRPQDLRAYADQAVDIATGLGDEVVVVGISGGGAVAAWMAQNRPEVDRALLLAPFFGVHGVPDALDTLLMNAFSRLPNVVLQNPAEPRRDWVYRGEATRGVAAFLAFGHTVIRDARAGAAPYGQVIVLTTAKDDTANNGTTAKVVRWWEAAGGDIVTYEFEPSLDIPHNSVDPAADATKKQEVYDRMLNLLGENAQSQAGPSEKPDYVNALEAIYGPPSQEGFGGAIFHERGLPEIYGLPAAALETYRTFMGELWERFGEDMWMSAWREVYVRESGAQADIVNELQAIDDRQAQGSVILVLGAGDSETTRAALAEAFDSAEVTELRVFNIGDNGAMSGLLVAGRRAGTGDATFLVVLLD